jgi:hypothetical protein
MSLPESLERAASEIAALADQIRPANGDPHRLLDELSANEGGQLLVWMLSEEPDAAADLIEVWCESDQGAAIVLSASDEGIPKVARRALRKARHRLRSQGVEAAISAPAPVTAKARRMSNAKDRWQVAHVSTLDFRGGRVGYLVDSHPSGGARLFEIRFDEARGIHDFKIYNAGRSKVRGFLRNLTGGSEQRLFEVDRDALRAFVRRASLALPADRPLPSAFIYWRGRLFQEDLEQQATPGDLVRAALAGPAEATNAAEAMETTLTEIRGGGLGPWPPKTSWVGDWMSSGRDAVQGLDGEARSSAIDSWLQEATESLSKETDTTLLAHHLDELAWIRWRSEDESGAISLLSVSGSLATNDQAVGQLSRARADGLFASFLVELRVVEEDGLAGSDSPLGRDRASE